MKIRDTDGNTKNINTQEKTRWRELKIDVHPAEITACDKFFEK